MSGTAREVKSWVAEEHRALLSAVRGVESILETSWDPETRDVAWRLNELAERLARHVEEEEPLLYAESRLTDLDHGPALRRLKAQHQPMIDGFRHLAGQVKAAPKLALESELSMQVRRLIAALRQHEADESALVHQIAQRS